MRLKPSDSKLYTFGFDVFLFQIGAIKTEVVNVVRSAGSEFLFQIGAIKTSR